MPQQTPILDLTLFDAIDDKPESFLAYRTAIAGTDASSNFNKIDSAINEDRIKFEAHMESAMPHLMTDHKTGKVYRYGERISAEGKPQIIYEEVI